MTRFLDMETLTIPGGGTYDPPPAGWSKTTAANAGTPRLISGAQSPTVGKKLWCRFFGSAYAIWYDSSVLGSPEIFAEIMPAEVANSQNSAAVLIDGPTANGYAINTTSTGVELIKLDAGVRNATPLQAVTTVVTSGATKLKIGYTAATKTLKMYKDGVQIGTSVVDETYTPLYGGAGSGPGRVMMIETTQAGAQVNSITNPVVMGSPISISTTGFSNVTSVTAAGIAATNVVSNAGTGQVTANWPPIAEGQVITTNLPAANVVFTVSDGVTSATISAPINLSSGQSSVIFQDVVTGDDKFIGYHVNIVNGDGGVYETPNGVSISPSGGIIYDNEPSAFTFKFFHHKTGAGGDDSITQYNVTTNSAGEIVSVGLTSAGLTSRGITVRGLTAVGL